MLSNAQAIIASIFKNEKRGKALGLNGCIVAIGGMSGPALGGILINSFGWHSVFFRPYAFYDISITWYGQYAYDDKACPIPLWVFQALLFSSTVPRCPRCRDFDLSRPSTDSGSNAWCAILYRLFDASFSFILCIFAAKLNILSELTNEIYQKILNIVC